MLNRPHVLELFTPAVAVTTRAGGDITLGAFVAIAAGDDREHPTVVTCPPGGRAFGVAATDATAGGLLLVQRGHGRCFRVPAGIGITAGADLEVGPGGAPVPATEGVVVAQALHASTTDYADVTLT